MDWFGRKRPLNVPKTSIGAGEDGCHFFKFRGDVNQSKNGEDQSRRVMAKRFKKYQIDALNAAFEESEHLTKQKKLELVGVTGLDVEQITSRFNRERSKRRTKVKMEDLEQKNVDLQVELRESKEKEAVLLKELQASKEREAVILKELQESKEREAELEAENWKLKQQQLEMNECNSHYDPILMFVKGLAKH